MSSIAPELTLQKRKMAFYNGKKAKPLLMAQSLRALAMILKVGESEARALQITGEQFKKYDVGRAFTRAAQTMREEGATFKQAIAAEDVFPRTVQELVAAAPTVSAMHKNLIQAANLTSQAQSVKKKLLIAMIQPGFMMMMCLVFMFIASAVILPGFVKTFATLQAETPPATTIMLNVTEVTKYVVGGIIALLILWALFWVTFGRRSDTIRAFMDRVSIKTPIMGNIVQLASTSRMFELLSTNLSTGMGESAALESAGAGSGNEAIRAHAYLHSQRMLNEGARLSEFAQTDLFPENAKYMLAAAPSVHQQIEIMQELAPEYRKEADTQLEAFSKTLEPLVNYVVYAVAGLLIVAVMVPMYAMFPALMDLSDGGTVAVEPGTGLPTDVAPAVPGAVTPVDPAAVPVDPNAGVTPTTPVDPNAGVTPTTPVDGSIVDPNAPVQ